MLENAEVIAERGTLMLDWNQAHILSRRELCWSTGVVSQIALEKWDQIDPWLQEVLEANLNRKTGGVVSFRRSSPESGAPGARHD